VRAKHYSLRARFRSPAAIPFLTSRRVGMAEPSVVDAALKYMQVTPGCQVRLKLPSGESAEDLWSAMARRNLVDRFIWLDTVDADMWRTTKSPLLMVLALLERELYEEPPNYPGESAEMFAKLVDEAQTRVYRIDPGLNELVALQQEAAMLAAVDLDNGNSKIDPDAVSQYLIRAERIRTTIPDRFDGLMRRIYEGVAKKKNIQPPKAVLLPVQEDMGGAFRLPRYMGQHVIIIDED
jgi:hypothetical protein